MRCWRTKTLSWPPMLLTWPRRRRTAWPPAMLDRLRLTTARLEAMAHDVRAVAALPDPVGEVFDQTVRPNGLRIHKRRVPLGVIGVVYEARPNVTSDVAALCLKTGNAAILRGGHEALRGQHRHRRGHRRSGLQAGGLPAGCRPADHCPRPRGGRADAAAARLY